MTARRFHSAPLAALVLCCPFVIAQTPVAQVMGRITDASGGIVPELTESPDYLRATLY